MNRKRMLLLAICGCAALGCIKGGGTSSSESGTPQGGLPIPMRGTDLSAYGIPGLIDLPAGCRITKLDESNVAIDREDDAFDLRVLPANVYLIPLASHRKSLQRESWTYIADEADGCAVWLHSNESRNHYIQVHREVTLAGRKFVAAAIIVDDRGSKELAESVWRTAKSLRAK
jgi:hypothetical protein